MTTLPTPTPRTKYAHPTFHRPTATNIDDAVEQVLSLMWPSLFPDTIPITAYEPVKIDPAPLNPLECLLEQLDEDHADPEGTSPTQPTPAMLEAQHTFIAAVLSDYIPFQLRAIETHNVRTSEWLSRHPTKFPDARQRSQST